MAQVSVNVSFEVTDPGEAQALIDQWKLHEGCNVFVSISDSSPPMTTDEGGSVVPVPEPESLEPPSPPENLGEGGG